MHGMKVTMPVCKHRHYKAQKFPNPEYSQIHFTMLTEPKSLLFKCSTTLRVFLKLKVFSEKKLAENQMLLIYLASKPCLK